MKTLVVLKPGWEKYSSLFHATTKGLSIVRFKEVTMPENFWTEFYKDHTKAAYWKEMSKYLSSSSCVFIILEGNCLAGCVVESARDLVVRLRNKHNKTSKDTENIAHASTSDEDAKKEIELLDKFYSVQVGCKT